MIVQLRCKSMILILLTIHELVIKLKCSCNRKDASEIRINYICKITLNLIYYCLVSEVVQWMFDDLCRPPDIRILHESCMMICSRRYSTLWGTHTRRHSCWVGPGSSVIISVLVPTLKITINKYIIIIYCNLASQIEYKKDILKYLKGQTFKRNTKYSLLPLEYFIFRLNSVYNLCKYFNIYIIPCVVCNVCRKRNMYIHTTLK